MKRVLAFDFGASSGRAMLGTYENGKISIEEIHRFSNDPVIVRSTMYWDVLRLFYDIKKGITLAIQNGGFDAIGIDTWGVDFGMLDGEGKLMGNPVHYRDERTVGVPEKVFDRVSREDIYKTTGIQFMRINTLYQLAYLEEKGALKGCGKILLMADLIAYFLTGAMRGEITNASTTNIFNPIAMDWNYELCNKLGINTKYLPKTIRAGEVYGNLSEDICSELGCDKVPVIAVATHDTASAVVACPAVEKDFVYISCGTWSLFGTENDTPVMNDDAMNANFTNEIGYNGKIRLLKNIMGLWIIQESRRQWIREGKDYSFDDLASEALKAQPFRCYIDCDDPVFETAGNMPKRIQEYCKKTEQFVPQTVGEIMRCVYQSLAMKYKLTFKDLADLTHKSYNSIHMVGGGIKAKLLCQMTADACGVNVDAGPTEATVMGNCAVQFMALEEIGDLTEVRNVIRNSTELVSYTPNDTSAWNNAYKIYYNIIPKNNK